MLKNFARVLSVAVLSALPLLAQPLPASAASAGTLFALQFNTVAKVDPSTAALTPFATLPAPPPTQLNPAFNGFASDPVGHRLFTVRSSISFDFSTQFYDLVTVDTQSGATTVSPDMPQGAPDLAFDSAAGALYGVTNFCCPFQLVRIDPATGAQTHIADLPGVQESFMAINPSAHVIYMISESFLPGQFQPVLNLLTVDASSGAITTSPQLSIGAFALAFDTSTGTLFGKSFCCPANLLKIDPGTGAETRVSTADLSLGAGFAIDSASHTIYMTQDVFSGFGFSQFLEAVNDQTGVISLSATAFPAGAFVSYMAFEGVAITPQSIEADVRAAVSSGSIDNAGVGAALLAQLNAAANARARGQCGVAARLYQAFIDTVNAQTGTHIAASTAAQLISEAEFLIKNCP